MDVLRFSRDLPHHFACEATSNTILVVGWMKSQVSVDLVLVSRTNLCSTVCIVRLAAHVLVHDTRVCQNTSCLLFWGWPGAPSVIDILRGADPNASRPDRAIRRVLLVAVAGDRISACWQSNQGAERFPSLHKIPAKILWAHIQGNGADANRRHLYLPGARHRQLKHTLYS